MYKVEKSSIFFFVEMCAWNYYSKHQVGKIRRNLWKLSFRLDLSNLKVAKMIEKSKSSVGISNPYLSALNNLWSVNHLEIFEKLHFKLTL